MVWNEILKIKTVMPTTVCCEQSFSVLKHVLHKNMAVKTMTAKVTMKLHQNVETELIEKTTCCGNDRDKRNGRLAL